MNDAAIATICCAGCGATIKVYWNDIASGSLCRVCAEQLESQELWEDSKKSNEDRALRAKKLLEEYSQLKGESFDLESSAIDLITDLMHLANVEEDIDFQAVLRMARNHYAVEVESVTTAELITVR
ncbi:hypothetical protein GF1_16810 [Desulfolithobacter dissulfuricans]|uniref:Uncharacterized protein n=1 Tax=Desulfolithobacter dissulfuricans TaxID=2795293 RepID=A0A915UA98_9BACT|nr:hypothetical protein [Desulfolithobacter dissulfuricans]BCO09305.1 hypothetical protein GF1_16810 [Desulfolithobacter dissulfuricans]